MSTPELEDILGALEEEAAAGDYRDVEPVEGDDYADYYREAEEGNPDYVYPLDEELQPEGNDLRIMGDFGGRIPVPRLG